jgi:hypothetical protein
MIKFLIQTDPSVSLDTFSDRRDGIEFIVDPNSSGNGPPQKIDLFFHENRPLDYSYVF